MHRLAGAGARVVGLDVSWSDGGSLGSAPGASTLHADVRDADAVQRILTRSGIDTVIHLAAQSLVGPANEHPVPTFETNIAGTWTVLEAARHHSTVTRIVVASSDKAYGDAGGHPYEESMPLLARHPYAVSKACADLLAQAYAVSYDMPVAVSRCGNLYGGGDLNWSRVIPGTIRSIIEGQRPVIRSDGSYVRDYLYVEDAVDGVLRLAEDVGERTQLCGESFNFGAGERLSVLDVVHRILSIMESDLDPDIRNEAENEIHEQRVSASKARTMLGWEPFYGLDQGLERTIAWYREHLMATP